MQKFPAITAVEERKYFADGIARRRVRAEALTLWLPIRNEQYMRTNRPELFEQNTFGTQGVQGQPVTRPVVPVHWPAQLTQENNFSGYAHTRVGAGLAKPDTDAALAR